MIIEFHRFSYLLNHTVFHNDNAVSHGHGFYLVVGYIDRSSADLSVKLADFGSHADTEFGVKV